MLSKSQARLFYVVATVGFSGVFLVLTVDTLLAVPEQTNQTAMTEDVLRGRHIWDENNCMGCHTILGEGAYYAPELTRVVERRGETWIRTFLRDPEAMYPGRRRMINYGFTEDEITDVIAFLAWIGTIDANGFPFDPDLGAPTIALTPETSAALEASPEVFGTVCQACHAVGGQGGNVGPALDGVALRYTAEELDAWLADPASVRPGTTMPNLNLQDDVRAALVDWLATLD